MIYLRFKRDVRGIYNTLFPVGTIMPYTPWPGVWQGMSEPERVEKGCLWNVEEPDESG